MNGAWDAIAWWEIRRIPFNLVLLVVGIPSGLIIVLIGNRVLSPNQDIGSPLLAAMLYAIAANLCYTLGWITELLWNWRGVERSQVERRKIFRAGLGFSVGLTFLPAVVLSTIWAAHGFR